MARVKGKIAKIQQKTQSQTFFMKVSNRSRNTTRETSSKLYQNYENVHVHLCMVRGECVRLPLCTT